VPDAVTIFSAAVIGMLVIALMLLLANVLAAGGNAFLDWRERRRMNAVIAGRLPHAHPDAPTPRDPKPEQTHCTDCGEILIFYRRTNGFNGKGNPVYHTALLCPNYFDYRRSVAVRLSSGVPETWPNCGEQKGSAWLPATHKHDPATMETDCAACVNDMVKEGIVTPADGRKMLGWS
jgi:hypothetical protein